MTIFLFYMRPKRVHVSRHTVMRVETLRAFTSNFTTQNSTILYLNLILPTLIQMKFPIVV